MSQEGIYTLTWLTVQPLPIVPSHQRDSLKTSYLGAILESLPGLQYKVHAEFQPAVPLFQPGYNDQIT